MLAFVFPGQGSQYAGMGEDFCEHYAEAREVYEESSDRLQIDMKELCFNSDPETLSMTANAQPAILTTSVAILRVLKNHHEVSPYYVAGHSLGEYTALVAAGTMSFSDAVYTVRKRGEFMQEAVPAGVGTMAAIIGLDNQRIADICNSVSTEGYIVSPANFNSSAQTVISGHRQAVEEACEKASQSGAKRAIPLNVSAPFHCSLMSGAAKRLREVLEGINFSDMEVPVVTNVHALPNTDSAEVTDLLVQQMVKPVKWMESVEFMFNNNVYKFVEIGPGSVLTGLIRRTVKGADLVNLEKVEHFNDINTNGI